MEIFNKPIVNQKTPTIIILDTDESVQKLLTDYFKKNNFNVECFTVGSNAIDAIKSKKPDIFILDLMLKGEDGLDICRTIRRFSNIPIIILSAKDDEIDKVLGLEMGADDYITKPFSIRELFARVKSVMRRSMYTPAPEEVQHLNIANIFISRVTRKVMIEKNVKVVDESGNEIVDIEKQKIILTPKEFDLLWYLATNCNKVFTRKHLLEKVWAHQEFHGDERTVDQHIKRLRTKLMAADCKCIITTIWGVGYKLEVLDEEQSYND